MRLFILTLFLAPLFSSSAFAQSFEEKAHAIDRHLMAPCCWSKTVAEESSPQALEMKAGVRSMLKEGKTKAEILSFFEEKYGERILSSPKTSGFNLLGWIFPIAIFIMGGILIAVYNMRMKFTPQTETTLADSSEVSSEDAKYLKQVDDELYGES